MASKIRDPGEAPDRPEFDAFWKEGKARGTKDGRGSWSRRRKILVWSTGSLAVLLVLVIVAGVYAYFDLQGNIHQEHVDGALGEDRPVRLNKSTNILLVGSDSRAGANARYGDVAGARSDTTILLHLSPSGDRALGISFPRDSMVQIPACKQNNGTSTRPYVGMLNAAFAAAGPVCTWKTIESTTGIHIDHFVEIDFSGFKNVVNALGGVEICVPQPIVDPKADLSLPAGRQVVKGDQALGYVRTRYVLGNGSDLERIRRQQKFMAAVVKKSLSAGTLTNPIKTYNLLSAVTKSITTDDKLTVPVMQKLAGSAKGMAGGKVQFVTVPNHPYPQDPNRVVWDAGQAKALFESIRQDSVGPAAPAPAAPVQPDRANVPVTVQDITVAKAKAAGQRLTAAGFTAVTTKTEKSEPGKTRVYYGPGAEQNAQVLATALGLKATAQKGAATGMVYVAVGPDGLKLPEAPAAIPKRSGVITAEDNVCGAG